MSEQYKIEVHEIISRDGLITLLNNDSNLGFFVFCKSGYAELTIDGELLDIKPNTVVNVISGASTEVNSFFENTNMVVVAYNNTVKNILGSHSLVVFCPVTGLLKSELTNDEFSDLLFYVNKIKKCISDVTKLEIAILNLILIVKELTSFNNLENSKRRLKNKVILGFNNLLDQNYKTDKSIESYCLQLNTTPKTLYRAFKEDVGISPKEFMNFKLNMEAKKLLTHSELSIKEVSYKLGFQSQYYFTNFFKKVNNISPSIFKEEMSDFSILMS